MATLEELIAQGLEQQGFAVDCNGSNGELFIAEISLRELAEFLSAHVVVGGKSKEQIP